MKRLLLASAAAFTLAAAMPAFAQITEPLPSTPPIVQPTPDPDTTTEQQSEVEAQAPVVEGAPQQEAQAEPSATAEPPSVAAQTSVAGEGQTAQDEPGAQPIPPRMETQDTPPQSAEADTPQTTTAQTETPQTPAPAAPTQPAPTTVAEAPPPDEAAETAAAGGATPAFASAAAVCQPRTTTVHFGRGRSGLSQQNRNAIEYAVDSASVCDLQQVTIVDSADGSVSSRRSSAVRAALVRQGVPEDRITIAEANNAGAGTGQLDVQMSFAGIAGAGSQMASNEPMSQPAAPGALLAPTPEAHPQPEQDQQEEQPSG